MPVRQVASRSPWKRHLRRPFCERYPKRRKSRPLAAGEQTAASQQTLNFSSGTAHSQPDGRAEQNGGLPAPTHPFAPCKRALHTH